MLMNLDLDDEAIQRRTRPFYHPVELGNRNVIQESDDEFDSPYNNLKNGSKERLTDAKQLDKDVDKLRKKKEDEEKIRRKRAANMRARRVESEYAKSANNGSQDTGRDYSNQRG